MDPRFLLIGLLLTTAACREDIQIDPVSAFQPTGLRGPVTFVRRTTQGPLDDTVTWTGDVTWIKQGTSVYVVLSGDMKVTHSLRVSGICSAERETTYRLKPDDGFLMADAKGAYTGYLRAEAKFSTKVSCASTGSGTVDEDVTVMDLALKGEVAESRLRGQMPVQTAMTTTSEGIWDFRYVF